MVNTPTPQSIEERDSNRLRAQHEHEAELAKIESIHATTAVLRREFEASSVGAVHRATKQALKDMLITPAPDRGGFGA